MYCEKCGFKADESDKSCKKCGNVLDKRVYETSNKLDETPNQNNTNMRLKPYNKRTTEENARRLEF